MMDRKKLLLLYNPSAGRAQTSRNLDMLLQKFCTGGCETTVYPILDGLNAEDILAGPKARATTLWYAAAATARCTIR